MDCCERCRRRRPVPAVGPQPCNSLWLGEGPGQEEDRRGVPFVGRSGRELTYQYMPMAGVTRSDVRIDNAIHCRQGAKDGDDPYPEDVEACARHHLPRELCETDPQYVVTLGAVALRIFNTDVDLEMVHGFPLEEQYYGGWQGTVFPCYHPAAGLRESSFMIRIQEDFRRLWLWRHGKLVLPYDRFPKPDYRHLRTEDDLLNVLERVVYREGFDVRGMEVGVDTETDRGKLWCMTWSPAPGTGYMIRADNPLMQKWYSWARRERPLLVFHNWLYDAPMLEEGAGIVDYRWHDTMEDAYTLGDVAQSLKVLAWRNLGMEMQEYEDLVLPYAREMAIEYLQAVSKLRWPEIVEAQPWKLKVRHCSGGKFYGGKHPSTPVLFDQPGVQHCIECGKPFEEDGSKMERDKEGKQYPWDRAAAILRDVEAKNSDPIKRWAAIPAEDRSPVEASIGTMQKPSITQVPEQKVIWYACRDADATRRIKSPLVARMAERGRRVRRAQA